MRTSRWQHPAFLMLLMALCLISRVMCPLQSHAVRSVRSHIAAARFARPMMARRVHSNGRLRLAPGTDQRAMPASPEDGTLPVAETSSFVQPLTPSPRVVQAEPQQPLVATPAISPLRI